MICCICVKKIKGPIHYLPCGRICEICSHLTLREQYNIIISRIDDSILTAKALCSKAWKANDQKAVWFYQAAIKDLELTKKKAIKPK